MSTQDNNTASSNGTLDGKSDYDHSTDQTQSYNNTHTPTPSSLRVNGFSPSIPDPNGPLQNPVMSPSLVQARQPINDAVASAVQTSDVNVPPELVKLITQTVIQQFQALSNPVAQPVQPPQPPVTTHVDQADNASSFATSPRTDRSQVYTPPSPHRSASIVNAPGYGTGARREFSPFQHSSDEEAVFSEPESTASKPQAPRAESDGDLSVLEKVWGRFFDDEGQSTKRLHLLLHGVAQHLIEDYEPKNSLVITTHKMQRYYQETTLSDQPEIYPWQHVFDDNSSSVSRLFREPEINIEHHLVQKKVGGRPDVPGLTIDGFAAWMTLLIRAHPEQEFERLLQTVRKMPINNPTTRERFPKDLPRRLFPTTGDDTIAIALAKHMTKHCAVQLHPRQPSNADSEAGQSQSSLPTVPRKPNPPAPSVEDASEESDRSDAPVPIRTTTSTTDSSGARSQETVSHSSVGTAPVENNNEIDGSDIPTPRPLERERNPYVGRSGGGKTYENATSSGDERHDNVNSSTKNSSSTQDDLRRIKSASAARVRQPPPPISIHQRGNAIQPDGPESARESRRARSSTVNDNQSAPVQRTRSNSRYDAEVQPHRRRRSNSTYASEAPPVRYHPKRSPSMTQSGFDFPRASAPEVKTPNYPPPPNSYSSGYPNSPIVQQGYDYRNQPYDPRDPRDPRNRDQSRDRDRDRRSSRTRMQSIATPSTADPQMYSDEHYRQQSGYQPTNGNYVQPAAAPYQYPPTAYRHERDPRDNRDPRDTRDTRDARDTR